MEKRISPDDERRMVGAIEKAAALALAGRPGDRSDLLADCLTGAGVDSRFAKVASDAFNRRLTVMTFRHTADDHKADSFELADSDRVLERMGGEPAQDKTASLGQAGFSVGMVRLDQGGMRKAASAPRRRNLEDRLSLRSYMRLLESQLDKQAAAYSAERSDFEIMDSTIERRRRELAGELGRLDKFAFRIMCNANGERLERAFSELMPEADFSVTYQVAAPDTELSRKVACLLDDIDHRNLCNDALAGYADGLDEFSKTAASLGRVMSKTAVSASGVVDKVLTNGAALSLLGLQDTYGTAKSLGSAASSGLHQIRDIRRAGGGAASAGVGDILSPEFINRERYRDRLLAWSDMMSDPLYTMYPSSQVFAATQKAMDIDNSMERADNREMLRAQVGQLLAQNNRAGMADLGALLSILQSKAELKPSDAMQGRMLADSQGAVTGPDTAPDLAPRMLSSEVKIPTSLDPHTMIANKDKELQRLKEKADDQAKQDAKDKASAAREAERDKDRREKDRAEAERKDRQDRDARERAERNDRRDADYQREQLRLSMERNRIEDDRVTGQIDAQRAQQAQRAQESLIRALTDMGYLYTGARADGYSSGLVYTGKSKDPRKWIRVGDSEYNKLISQLTGK